VRKGGERWRKRQSEGDHDPAFSKPNKKKPK